MRQLITMIGCACAGLSSIGMMMQFQAGSFVVGLIGFLFSAGAFVFVTQVREVPNDAN